MALLTCLLCGRELAEGLRCMHTPEHPEGFLTGARAASFECSLCGQGLLRGEHCWYSPDGPEVCCPASLVGVHVPRHRLLRDDEGTRDFSGVTGHRKNGHARAGPDWYFGAHRCAGGTEVISGCQDCLYAELAQIPQAPSGYAGWRYRFEADGSSYAYGRMLECVTPEVPAPAPPPAPPRRREYLVPVACAFIPLLGGLFVTAWGNRPFMLALLVVVVVASCWLMVITTT